MRTEILRFFGLGVRQEPDEPDVPEPEADDSDQGEGSSVSKDREDKIPSQQTPSSEETTEKERRSALRAVKAIVQNLVSLDFLQQRSAEQLGIDLGIASILFRSGLAEGWLGYDDFFKLTHEIWSVVFFDSEQKTIASATPRGWLQVRHEQAGDKRLFVQQLASVHLAASLMAWALAVRQGTHTVEEAFFDLAAVASTGRLPWLWKGAHVSRSQFESSVILSLVNTGIIKTDDTKSKEAALARLRELLLIGAILCKIEGALGGAGPAELKGEVRKDGVARGELLWQGRRGLCVAAAPCRRSDHGSVKVLCLQRQASGMPCQKDHLIPLDAFLESERLGLTTSERDEFKGFAERLGRRIASWVDQADES